MTLVGRVFTNRYEIQRELAQGGMAEVYLAHDRLLDRPVALKALFPEFAREPSFVERFRREAQAAANLNHPNIVAIYDWGQESGTYFLVMEYVEGRSLRDVVRSDGPLDPNLAADIAAETAGALAAAHRAGLVHRDVKPGNVLLTRAGTVKVADFGIIARPGASDGLTQTGSVMGTATYFSPEQAQGFAVDPRSDLYSLGVVLYEMVTGVAPFAGDSPVAVAYKHVREEPVPPARRNPSVPPALEQIILTAMAKDPALRYQSADDMRADLLRFRRGRPLAGAAVTALVTEVGDDPFARTQAAPRVVNPDATRLGPAVHDDRSNRRRALYTTLTVLVLLAAVAGIFLLSQMAGGDAGKVDVPNVVGRSQDDAERILRNEGFKTEVVPVQSDEPVDRVVSQEPEGGTKAKRGGDVVLEVSAGTGKVDVPSVGGLRAPDAEQLLKDAGLVPRLVSESNKDVPPFEVIRTDPPEGDSVDKGSTVRVFVSTGPEKVEVPNVLNQDAVSATATLVARGFVVSRVDRASDDVPLGRVIDTDPKPNTEAPDGSTIQLIVSSGPETSDVPPVVGLSEADARSALTAAGLNVSTVFGASTPGNEGNVIAQDPAAGAQVAPGSTVVITVGEVSTPTTTTTTTVP